jgi:hypothetical protein
MALVNFPFPRALNKSFGSRVAEHCLDFAFAALIPLALWKDAHIKIVEFWGKITGETAVIAPGWFAVAGNLDSDEVQIALGCVCVAALVWSRWPDIKKRLKI